MWKVWRVVTVWTDGPILPGSVLSVYGCVAAFDPFAKETEFTDMAMKRLLLTLMLLGTSLLIFAQDYPFSVVKSGTGKQTVIFIPGFACSGDVWAETVSVLKDSYTCYVLTMAEMLLTVNYMR